MTYSIDILNLCLIIRYVYKYIQFNKINVSGKVYLTSWLDENLKNFDETCELSEKNI